jgi:hypothetical protein
MVRGPEVARELAVAEARMEAAGLRADELVERAAHWRKVRCRRSVALWSVRLLCPPAHCGVRCILCVVCRRLLLAWFIQLNICTIAAHGVHSSRNSKPHSLPTVGAAVRCRPRSLCAGRRLPSGCTREPPRMHPSPPPSTTAAPRWRCSASTSAARGTLQRPRRAR